MMFALVLMGLLPAFLLPDLISDHDSDDDHDEPDPLDHGERTTSMIDDIETADLRDAIEQEDPTSQASEADADPASDPVAGGSEVPSAEEEDDQGSAPVIEDDLPQPPPEETTDDGIEPMNEDDEPGTATEPEPGIDPNSGDDIDSPPIVEDALARPQIAPAEEDEEWIFASDLADGQAAEIADFEPGKDVLRIQVDPDQGFTDLSVSVKTATDETDSEVYIGDQLVALLKDAPGVSASDVIVEVRRFS